MKTIKTKYLTDYKASSFSIKGVKLDFSLFDKQTIVTARIEFIKDNKRAKNLQLVGENLQLIALAINGKAYKNYKKTDTKLVIKQVPNSFVLTTQVVIHPEANTSLEGLFLSNKIFCTQCEPEGFRHITYFLDRPDVMTTYQVRIEADKKCYTTLLSNGNLLEHGDLPGNRHFAIWHDPFAKPCYLFALVAGDLAVLEKEVKTISNKKKLLQIFTEKKSIYKAQYALGALERAMHWDEKVFGLEYDLERYMVVAIDHFNMGAMENKGLNIFNTKYLLATPKTATDNDFMNVENIIAHEYFHNWTGNRVTCRDWFQISLKEGLTVFRDALFSADMTTKGIKRLKDVRVIREHQFIEDQGPMSHPVRPDNYMEINNFYTLTVYEKGAEIVRMIYNIVGENNFKKGINLYFKRHDGTAITVEDFVKSLSDASGVNLMGQFFRWYTQSGTPELHVKTKYDSDARIFSIHFEQHNPPTAKQKEKQNLVIPIAYRLYNNQGKAISAENLVILNNKTKIVEFGSIETKPIVSLLRNFSAPVTIKYEQSNKDLHTLVRYDDDLFVRFDAMQLLLKRAIANLLYNQEVSNNNTDINDIANSIIYVINDNTADGEKAEILKFPDLSVFFDIMDLVDVDKLSITVETFKQELIKKLTLALENIINLPPKFPEEDLSFDAISERSYRNVCLDLLATNKHAGILEYANDLFVNSNIMTNRLVALNILNKTANQKRKIALKRFYEEFSKDSLVMDKWLAIQAIADFDDTIDNINKLAKHPVFSITSPNKVKALYGTFFSHNFTQFHHISGRGYKLLTNVVTKLDKINPQVSSSIVKPFTQWRRFDKKRQKLIQDNLISLSNNKKISKDLYEIISKSL